MKTSLKVQTCGYDRRHHWNRCSPGFCVPTKSCTCSIFVSDVRPALDLRLSRFYYCRRQASYFIFKYMYTFAVLFMNSLLAHQISAAIYGLTWTFISSWSAAHSTAAFLLVLRQSWKYVSIIGKDSWQVTFFFKLLLKCFGAKNRDMGRPFFYLALNVL